MRILIADDQAKVRFALRILLERQPGLEVIGEAANGQDLLAKTSTLRPDLVLVVRFQRPVVNQFHGNGIIGLIVYRAVETQ